MAVTDTLALPDATGAQPTENSAFDVVAHVDDDHGAAQPRRASGYGPELLDEMTVCKVVHIAPPQADR